MNDPAKDAPLSAEHFERRSRWLNRLLFSIRRLVVQDVPAADARCEFGCRQPECRYEQWADCKKRIDESRK